MQQVADTLAADSLVVSPAEAADTTGSLARLNAELEQASDLLFTGELGHSTGVLYEGLSAFVLHWAPRLLSALVLFCCFMASTGRFLHSFAGGCSAASISGPAWRRCCCRPCGS